MTQQQEDSGFQNVMKLQQFSISIVLLGTDGGILVASDIFHLFYTTNKMLIETCSISYCEIWGNSHGDEQGIEE